MVYWYVVFFFFQAEDVIRVRDVTGVQTCALPISRGVDVHRAQVAVAGDAGTARASHLLRDAVEGDALADADDEALRRSCPRKRERKAEADQREPSHPPTTRRTEETPGTRPWPRATRAR